MAFNFQSNDWRRPGCGNTCHIKYVFLPGLSGREPLQMHDPEAHEAWGGACAEQIDAVTAIVETGPLRIDLQAREVTINGRLVLIRAGEWAILSLLARHIGRRFSVAELVVMVRGQEFNDDAGHHAFRMGVYRLRQHLGEAGYLLNSRSHIGYCLMAAPSAIRETAS